MLGLVEDSQYGIPRRCACGGRIIDEVRGKEDYDSHPGKRYFTCINYESSLGGWCPEEMERLRKRPEEAEEVIKVWSLITRLRACRNRFEASQSRSVP
ncbi:hypothetical protein Bca52824_043019 [Brassica carinata]|uniref:Uncharacterized protein n=1 Tax=Brassica carinata TaxID=52824 RepID=A0A8X7S0E8_BRACI|nr:hypothetical protein Bca52824_043019 [Brassica carinata]